MVGIEAGNDDVFFLLCDGGARSVGETVGAVPGDGSGDGYGEGVSMGRLMRERRE